MSNIIGLDLNIDQDYLASAVQQTVMMGISEALNGKNEIVSQIVKSVLHTKVDDRGRISSYDRDNKYSLLEIYVKQALTEAAKEELISMVEEKKPFIKELIREKILETDVQQTLVDNFFTSVCSSITSPWRTKVDVEFMKESEG